MTDRLLTTSEVAVLLGLRPSSVRSAIARGRMLAEKHGRDYIVRLVDAREYELTRLGKVGWPAGRPRRGEAARK